MQTDHVPDDSSDICGALSRADKWFLGGPGRLAWTPTHPQDLDIPGFWDEAHYYDVPMAPIFTLTLLSKEARMIPCRFIKRRWRPDAITQHYEAEMRFALTEKKAWVAQDVLVSQLDIENTTETEQTVHLLAWTVQPLASDAQQGHVETAYAEDERIHFTRCYQDDEARRSARKISCVLGMDRPPSSFAMTPSESGPLQPEWTYTPFYEGFSNGQLAETPSLNGRRLEQKFAGGVLYMALHAQLEVPVDATTTLTTAFSAAPSAREAGDQMGKALQEQNPIAVSTAGWNAHFDDVPSFSCSDPYLDTYYWYRWYGLHLFSAQPGAINYRYPAVFEGAAYFRKLITYSAQCHMREARWLNNPMRAQGSLLNFVDNQAADGRFYGHLFAQGVQDESFYHADWSPFWQIFLQHQDESFLRRAYDGLKKYLAYFDRERDPEGSGLYDIWNHYETGQEYMHRYVAVSETADEIHWGRNFRLKGVDVAVQIYRTKQTMARAALRLGHRDESKRWEAGAEATKTAIREQMWDAQTQMFFDINPDSGKRTKVKAATCFYPYMTDIVTKDHVGGLKQHLFNPDEFWTPFPVPSSSRDDVHFRARPHWKKWRMNCPWNGRVWPMANSHVAEAIAHSAIRFEDGTLREKTAAFIQRYIRMLFDEQDPARPNCFEHYNPLSGQPSRYRGINDYQHSWIADLILKYLCGLRIDENSLTVDPFPFDIEHFSLQGAPVRGQLVDIARDGNSFQVTVDGTHRGESTLGTPLHLSC